MHMNRFSIDNCPPAYETTGDGHRVGPDRDITKLGCQARITISFAIDQRIACFTKPRRILRDYIQHRLNIRRRTGDHTQNFARCRLLLQSFGNLAITFLQFFEQPDVFDRDHGLIREGFEQRDLLLAERQNLVATNQNRPNRSAFTKQGHGQNSADTEVFNESRGFGKFHLSFRAPHVVNMYHLPVDHRSARNNATE